MIFDQKTARFQNFTFWLNRSFKLSDFMIFLNFHFFLHWLTWPYRLPFLIILRHNLRLNFTPKKVISVLNITSVINCLDRFLIDRFLRFLGLGVTHIFGGGWNIVFLSHFALKNFWVLNNMHLRNFRCLFHRNFRYIFRSKASRQFIFRFALLLSINLIDIGLEIQCPLKMLGLRRLNPIPAVNIGKPLVSPLRPICRCCHRITILIEDRRLRVLEARLIQFSVECHYN